MTQRKELKFARAIEHLFRIGHSVKRFGGPPRGDSLPEILISRNPDIICAAISLCGTRTLKNFFSSNPVVNYNGKILRDKIPNILKTNTQESRPLVFSVVRNPWSRVVSCYEKKIRGAYIKESYRQTRAISIIAGYKGLSTNMSFDAFVEWLCNEKGTDETANRHWMSQHKFLSNNGSIDSNIKILKLESLEKGLNSVLGEFGLPYQPIPKTNSSAAKASQRLHSSTRAYYSKKTIDAIANRYATDIEIFGYEFH